MLSVSLDLLKIAELAGVGLAAGIIGGLLGVGGSIIMIPAMVHIFRGGPASQQHLYQAVAMIVNVFVAFPAAVRHWMAGAVVKPVIRFLVPGAVTGVLAGVAVSNVFHNQQAVYLGYVFAAFLMYATAYNVYRLIRRNRLPDMTEEMSMALSPVRVFVVGAGMGLAAGLTGVGGGVLAVPMQQVFLRMPLKKAIANSAFTITFSAIIGAFFKNATLSQHGISILSSFAVAAMLIPSAFIGGYLGAHLTHRLPREPVRILFILLLILGTVRMLTVSPTPKADPAAPAGPTNPPAASAPDKPAGQANRQRSVSCDSLGAILATAVPSQACLRHACDKTAVAGMAPDTSIHP